MNKSTKIKRIHFVQINSTNTYLKENYQKLDNLTLVSCDHQTNGKGRLGRTWLDGDDLLFSILIKEKLDKVTDYSLLIATTLYKVLSEYVDNLSIKWPNDILLKDKKLVGILLEAVTKDDIECAIIGCGINVNSFDFPLEIKAKATSLFIESGKKIDKNELCQKIILQFEKDYNLYLLGSNDYLEVINNHFYLKNKEVSFNYKKNNFQGIVKGMDDSGNLLVETQNGLLSVSSGEVTLTHLYR